MENIQETCMVNVSERGFMIVTLVISKFQSTSRRETHPPIYNGSAVRNPPFLFLFRFSLPEKFRFLVIYQKSFVTLSYSTSVGRTQFRKEKKYF